MAAPIHQDAVIISFQFPGHARPAQAVIPGAVVENHLGFIPAGPVIVDG
jgi:hypothetical protein